MPAAADPGANRPGRASPTSAPAGFEAFFAKNNAWLYQLLLHLTRGQAVAEELRQETLVRACLHWDTLGQLHEAQQRKWLLTTARNLVADHVRRGKWRVEEPVPDAPEEVDRFGQADLALDARRALSRLSYLHREVLALYYLADLPLAEIARILNVKPTVVTSRLDRARRALQRAMGYGGMR